MHGENGHNTRPQARCHTVFWTIVYMDDFATERSFASQAKWVMGVLDLLFLHVIHECLNNQTLPDARSTGVGIKCLY